MKRRLIISLLVVCGLTAGTVVYQNLLFTRLSASLDTQITNIADVYGGLAKDQVLPLASEKGWTELQRRILDRIESNRLSLETDKTLDERLQHISALQQGMIALILSVTPDQALSRDERFLSLQIEMSERGKMRELLQMYNDTALRWNNAVQSELGSITTHIGGDDRHLLPFLRFDGVQEFVPVVEL